MSLNFKVVTLLSLYVDKKEISQILNKFNFDVSQFC